LEWGPKLIAIVTIAAVLPSAVVALINAGVV
jgi:hypothetical protein